MRSVPTLSMCGANRAGHRIAPRRRVDSRPLPAMKVRMKTDPTSRPPNIVAVLPLCIARSALFAVGRYPTGMKPRRAVPIAPYRGAKLIQTGPALGQHHALAWQAVIHWAKDAGIEDERPFTVAADDLLRVLGGRGGDSAQRFRMMRWLTELAATRIEYETDTHAFAGPLLGQAMADARGWPVLRLPDGWQALTRVEILRNDLGRKSGLGMHTLALWLHDYIGTQLRPPPETVDTLRQWSGSTQDLAHFRHDLRVALRRLAATVVDPDAGTNAPSAPAPGALVLNWHIDRRDRLRIDKADTSVYLSGGRAGRGAGTTKNRQQAEIQRARMQRANVAL